MISYVFLGTAIVLELIATTLLKQTEGFTRICPTLACIALYICCFFCLSRALLKLNLGIAYALWCGVGIIVTAVISALLYKQMVSPMGVVGIVMITAGCVILNLSGGAD